MAVSSILKRANPDARAAFFLRTSASRDKSQGRPALTVQTRSESPMPIYSERSLSGLKCPIKARSDASGPYP